MAAIHEALIAIMREVPAIGKDSRNQSQGFNFRGIDAVYNELHGLMAKHGVFTTSRILDAHHEERQTKNGSTLLYRIYQISYTFHAADGSSVESVVVGEGMDSGDKASNKAMAVSHKYALLQLLIVPTVDMVDPDSESHEVATQPPKVDAHDIASMFGKCSTVAELTQTAHKYKSVPMSDEERTGLNAAYKSRLAKLNEGAV